MEKSDETKEVLNRLVAAWPPMQRPLRQMFVELSDHVRRFPGVEWSLIERRGVSFSFRATLAEPPPGRERPVFFLVDVIVSEADPWWLSVCYYEDEISDPSGEGNAIPRGLFDETGYCFDALDLDDAQLGYLKERIFEAYVASGGRPILKDGPESGRFG